MRPKATFPLTICFVTITLLFSTGGSLLAEEEIRATAPLGLPAVSAAKGESENKELRKQEEALKKQIEELNRQLQEIKKKNLNRQEAPATAPSQVELPLPPGIERRRPAPLLGKVLPAKALMPVRPSIPAQPLAEPLSAAVPFGIQPPMAGGLNHPMAPGKRGIELKIQELENALRSRGDAGLVTLLRFEKAKVCRKAGMHEEAIAELQRIIEENLADETTNAARWTLVEILQEQKKNEEAIAELEKIFVSASDIQDRTDAMYGIINLSGEGPKARIQAIDRLIQALLREKANWEECVKNLEQLYAAERKYAEDHGGHLSERLSDLYPDYLDDFDVFICPAAKGQKITRKEDIDSLTSYILVAKGEPVEGRGGESERRPYGRSFDLYSPPQGKIWVREKEQNHGRRYLAVYSNGAVGWVGAPYPPAPFPDEPVVPMGPYRPVPLMEPGIYPTPEPAAMPAPAVTPEPAPGTPAAPSLPGSLPASPER